MGYMRATSVFGIAFATLAPTAFGRQCPLCTGGWGADFTVNSVVRISGQADCVSSLAAAGGTGFNTLTGYKPDQSLFCLDLTSGGGTQLDSDARLGCGATADAGVSGRGIGLAACSAAFGSLWSAWATSAPDGFGGVEILAQIYMAQGQLGADTTAPPEGRCCDWLATSASAGANAVVSVSQPISIFIQTSGTAVFSPVPAGPNRPLLRYRTIFNGVPLLGFDRSVGGVRLQNMSPDPNNPTDVTGSATVAAPAGTVNAGLRNLSISVNDIDVNGDGRFTSQDVNILVGAVNSPATGVFAQFDANANGVLNSDEIETFVLAEAVGMAVGIFGDVDLNGSVTCADRDAAPLAPWDFNIDHPSYAFEYDANLDGIMNEADRVAFVALFTSCLTCDSLDFNNDGDFPTPLDVEDFIAAVEGNICATCSTDIDFNNDGDFPSPLDIEAFISVSNGGPCV